MKVWHDDIRPPPAGWVWVRTNSEAQAVLGTDEVEEISLDHDLGLHGYSEEEIRLNPDLLFGKGQAEETGYHLVCWMTETGKVPPKVTIHSWNPDGARNMAARLNSFGHDCIISPFVMRHPAHKQD